MAAEDDAHDKDAIFPVETETLLLIPPKKKGAGAGAGAATAGKNKTCWQDAADILRLSGPIFLAQVSWLGMKTTDTALLGHVGADALAAAALSDLWTMCTAVLIQGRVLGILVGGAVGANNPKLAGIYLQVSYVVLSILAVLVIVAWNLTEQVWLTFGSDPQISKDAGYYARVLSISIPGLVIFGQLSQYFAAQRILEPEVHSSLLALGANLVLGLIFVLGIGVPNNTNFRGYGFAACPIVTALVVYLQIAVFYVVYIHIQRLHEQCWDGWKWKEITRERIWTFSGLYFPSALGTTSDFWRVAVIGAVAAKLGEEEVAVFNTSYRIMWIVLTMVNAMSMAAGINMSMRLGKLDAVGARQAGHVGAIMSLVFLLLVFGAVAWNIRAFGMIFTQDETFLNLFAETRWPFTITLVLMNLSVAIERIPYSMGRTTEVFWMGCIASWGGTLFGLASFYLFSTVCVVC
jgi:MATE family multidrug resistance protein